MSIKNPLGLLHSVLWHAMWCSMIICMCLLENGQRSFCHFSLLLHSICYARSFWNSPLHIFCMLSSLEIPCVLKLQLMHLPLMYLYIQFFLRAISFQPPVWFCSSPNKISCNIRLGHAITFARGKEKKNYKSLLNITERKVLLNKWLAIYECMKWGTRLE